MHTRTSRLGLILSIVVLAMTGTEPRPQGAWRAATPDSGALDGRAPAARTFRVVKLTGTPRQRGLQHGTTLREEIRAGVAGWKKNLEATFRMDPDAFIKAFVANTNYLPAIERWTPGLLDEVRGIAAGSGIDFPTMLTFQLVDEYWVNGDAAGKEHCSGLGIGATTAHGAVIAQNMDLEGFRDGFQTLLHVEDPSGLQAYVLTMPGLIAMNGMNNRGVGVTANTLAQLAHNRDGLPVAFVVRGVLERRTFAEAAAFLRSVRHASGQNYIVGGSGRVAFFEASSAKVVEVSSNRGFIYHTNHPLANDDYSEGGAIEMRQPNMRDNTRTRYAALQKRLAADPGGDVVGLAKDTLRSRDSDADPVCRHLRNEQATFTYASTIMVLSAPDPHLVAAPGPPDQQEYAVFRFGPAARRK
jgi:isopenicillin-N N-acyltransferase-like protein